MIRVFRKKIPIFLFFSLLVCSFFGYSLAQLHFVSLGSFGSGAATQRSVASVLESKAKDYSVSFIISPGTNFFDGVSDLNDPKWKSSFEKPYEGSSLSLPFFTVAGEGDWKGNYTALPLRTNQTYGIGHQFPRWTLPNWWYYYSAHFSDSTGSLYCEVNIILNIIQVHSLSFFQGANAAFGSAGGSAGFVFIDTFILSDRFRFQYITKLHWDNLRDTITAASRIYDWVIVVGDKAILSSGSSKGDSYLSKTLRPFLKELNVDAYISGNDNDMEVIEVRATVL